MNVLARFPYTEESKMPEIFMKEVGMSGLATTGKCAVASTAGYVFFSGGNQNRNVVAYSSDMTKHTCSTLTYISDELGGASQYQNYAWFAGGIYDSPLSNVRTYSNTLTKSDKTALSKARYGLVGTSTSRILTGPVIFAGGIDRNLNSANTVDAYDADGTKITATSLSSARDAMISGCVASRAVFLGGRTTSGGIGSGSDGITTYNSSLTKTDLSGSLYSSYEDGAATNVGDYLLFAGRMGAYTDGRTVAFDSTFTMKAGPTLRHGRSKLGASSIGKDIALFSSGNSLLNDAGNPLVDVVNSDLTRVGELNFTYYSQPYWTHAGSSLNKNSKCTFVSKYNSGYQMVVCYYIA